jgi:hypothetical protein
MWTHYICETRTGLRITEVKPLSGSFSRKLNGVGTGTHTFLSKTLGEGASTAARRNSRLDLTRTWARTLVQCWDGRPKYAGLIVGKSVDADGKLSVRTAELRELFKYRTTFGQNGYNGELDGRFVLQSQSLASIAGHLLWDVMQGPTGNWQLPLILPPRGMSGPESVTYHEFNLPVIETELAAIQNTEGGPDLDFDPSWADDNSLQWTSRVGDLSGATLEWRLDAPKSGLTDFSMIEDGNAQGSIFYAVGNGSDRRLKVATSKTVQESDEIALERIVQYSQERDKRKLSMRASEDLRTFKRPTRQYGFSMQADGDPNLRNLRLGQTIRVYADGHEWLPDGWLTQRLVGFTGDLTKTIKLQLQAP